MGYRGVEDDTSWGLEYHSVAATPSRKYSRQGSYTTSPASIADLERPQTLEIPLTPRTPLRSSLRKNSGYSNRYTMGGGGSSGKWFTREHSNLR